MEPIVELGPLMFRLKDATVATLPDFGHVQPLLIDGLFVRPLMRAGTTLLIVDHRSVGADAPARVEYWSACPAAGATWPAPARNLRYEPRGAGPGAGGRRGRCSRRGWLGG